MRPFVVPTRWRARVLNGARRSDPQVPVAPLLRWVGGKQRLVGRLREFAPRDFEIRRYFEPFLGAASVFLSIRPRQAVLSDANPHLIETYRAIRDHPVQVSRHLRRFATLDSATLYYQIRDDFNEGRLSCARAARFIYLNRTCFNGIYRVNKRGDFNVPYGYKRSPIFPDRAHIHAISRALRGVTLKHADYSVSLREAKEGDFIYLDPPYPPLNGTSYFAHYTVSRFSLDQQRSLAVLVNAVSDRGSLVMMTNADHPLIRRLYRGFRVQPVEVTRHVTCKAVKHAVGELVITNY